MKPSPTAIKLRDFLTLVVVWELHEGYWQILTLTRLRCAIALTRESPTTRLVFPTGVFPDGVWGGIYKHRASKTNSKKVDLLQQRQKRVLQLLQKSPGQTRDSLAEHLGISVATALQLLRKMEKAGDIHHHPHPMQNKTKLYYAGSLPSNKSTLVTSSSRKAVPDARRESPLKVYFVEPRTLQLLNR